MDTAQKMKLVGIGLMLPAIGLIGYLIISPKMWLIAFLNIIFTLMAMVGWHMFKGDSVKQAVTDVVNDIKNQVDAAKDTKDAKDNNKT